ncbi:hypothetical protein D8674_004735 [Pyrus ussuriensis x Pyrus communis]|uniref:Uncharacterized protein n=1 Tax=Pyrus ussuriensis x Pyrus communis TaxID=2448454 RepID=A0A5N5FQS8_9ROSA|nr:hypothetical protein D8674_003694 [Pyrus ussuriensis x Pyrus communis]KAB2603730.1 hypothetical protein D8674_004735 [Pyrus ussuriensis x Pyrus communis]
MGTTGVLPVTPLGPTVSMAPALSTSSVMHPVLSTQRTHQQPQSSEKVQQSGKASSPTIMEKGHTVLEEVASQLPVETPIKEVFPSEDAGFQIMMDTLDRTFGRQPGNVEMLTFEVVDLKELIAAQQSQNAAQNNLMNQIRRAL